MHRLLSSNTSILCKRAIPAEPTGNLSVEKEHKAFHRTPLNILSNSYGHDCQDLKVH